MDVIKYSKGMKARTSNEFIQSGHGCILSQVERAALRLVCVAGMRPLIVGSVALRIWGAKLVTPDLDLVADWSGKQLGMLRKCVNEQSGQWGLGFDNGDVRTLPEARFRIEGLKVDLLRARSRRFKEVIRRARPFMSNGNTLLIAELEDAALLKVSLGRHKDFLHLKEVLLSCPSINLVRLKDAAEEWGVSKGLEGVDRSISRLGDA